jgi:hypothetical protein
MCSAHRAILLLHGFMYGLDNCFRFGKRGGDLVGTENVLVHTSIWVLGSNVMGLYGTFWMPLLPLHEMNLFFFKKKIKEIVC